MLEMLRFPRPSWTVIITGIGLETAVNLAKRNARMILTCRGVERGERSAVQVRKRSGNEKLIQLDLWSPWFDEEFFLLRS